MDQRIQAISAYFKKRLKSQLPFQDGAGMALIFARIEKALSFLPDYVLDIFLSGRRILSVEVLPDTGLPLGMSTRSDCSSGKPRYTIVVHPEHKDWPEARFIGGFLRELGHVVAERPPEDEWPQSRGDRSRFREQLECKADAMVWQWGLRHYSMVYLAATYPPHWVDRIVEQIENMLRGEDQGPE